jgi:hypothetical protein
MSRSFFSQGTRIVKEKVSVAVSRTLRYTLPDSENGHGRKHEETMSALRKLLNLGMLFTSGPGWKIHPLASNLYALETDSGKTFLSDGERNVEYPSLAAALETRVTRRKLLLGEAL